MDRNRIKIGNLNLYVEESIESIEQFLCLPAIRKMIFRDGIFICVKEAFIHYFKIKEPKGLPEEEFLPLEEFIHFVWQQPNDDFKKFKKDVLAIRMTTGCNDATKIFSNARALYANMTLDDLVKSMEEFFRTANVLQDSSPECVKVLVNSFIKKLELMTAVEDSGYSYEDAVSLGFLLAEWFKDTELEKQIELTELCKQALPNYKNFKDCVDAFKRIING